MNMGRRKKIFGVALFSAIIGCCLLCAVNLKARDHRSDRIILIVADALRADHVGCYGAPGNPTPHIDALAARGWRFTDALAPGSETVTSNRALFTGLHPYRARGSRRWDLHAGVPTIATCLSDAGFRTAGFSAQRIISKQFGYDQGFESFTCLSRRDDRITTLAIDWISRHRRDRYFLLIYLLDPHGPYDPTCIGDRERRAAMSGPSDWTPVISWRDPQTGKRIISAFVAPLPPDARTERVKVTLLHALYRNEVRMADARVGRLMQAIGDDNRATIIFLADHGEEWAEHGGLWHERTLFREVLHVPFIVSRAGIAPRVVHAPVTQMDIAPTIFAFAGIAPPPGLDGRSLGDPDAIPTRTLFAEKPDGARRGIHDCAAYTPNEAILRCSARDIAGRHSATPPSWVRYDLATDPNQQHPVPVGKSDVCYKEVAAYYAKLCSSQKQLPSSPPLPLSPEVRDELRALGYIAK